MRKEPDSAEGQRDAGAAENQIRIVAERLANEYAEVYGLPIAVLGWDVVAASEPMRLRVHAAGRERTLSLTPAVVSLYGHDAALDLQVEDEIREQLGGLIYDFLFRADDRSTAGSPSAPQEGSVLPVQHARPPVSPVGDPPTRHAQRPSRSGPRRCRFCGRKGVVDGLCLLCERRETESYIGEVPSNVLTEVGFNSLAPNPQDPLALGGRMMAHFGVFFLGAAMASSFLFSAAVPLVAWLQFGAKIGAVGLPCFLVLRWLHRRRKARRQSEE